MMKPRIYADTSVIGGCVDAEFEGPSDTSSIYERYRHITR